jgi:hypothetical protein
MGVVLNQENTMGLRVNRPHHPRDYVLYEHQLLLNDCTTSTLSSTWEFGLNGPKGAALAETLIMEAEPDIHKHIVFTGL